MPYVIILLLAVLAFIGHTALWVSTVNRLNSFALNYTFQRWVNRACLFCCATFPLLVAAWWLWQVARSETIFIHAFPAPQTSPLDAIVLAYVWLCWGVGLWAIGVWLIRRLWPDDASFFVQSNHTERFDVAKLRGENLSGNYKAAICSRIPGNQLFQFHTQTKNLRLPGLPPALDGFSIAHLSDLHFAGHVRREFHDDVVRQTNRLGADLIVITGDIIDRQHCLSWLAETLGQLRAPLGVHFILGNHDCRRCNPVEVRRALVDLGLIDLGGRSAVLEHNGTRVLLAGNELPWLAAPPKTSDLPFAPGAGDALSILLSHSPDQFVWAQRAGYKLMFAGHVHGGQIRPPVVGPMLSPSRHGVRYASGVFYSPPTLMHVSRGVSGMIPLRFNCPPEVAKLVLRSATH